jgi:hypothetical protein
MRTTMSRSSWVGCLLGGVLLSTCLTGTACARAIQGQVLDAQTGQPIVGAVVLGVWTRGGGLPGLSHTELAGVREAETDGEGRFALEEISGWLLDEKQVTIYKFGYVAWSNQFVFPTFARRKDTSVPAEVRLDTFSPGDNHREHVRFISLGTAAGVYDELNPQFQKAIDRELRMR